MKFLFDENMPELLVRAMRPIAEAEQDELGHILTQFGQGAPDVQWLAQFGDDREWVVVSRDGFNKSMEEKREIVARSRCTFILSKGFGNLPLWELMGRLLLRWPQIRTRAQESRLGVVYRLGPTGAKIEDITNSYI